MGQGGYLTLANMTPFVINKTGEHSYQMNSWNLPDKLNTGDSPRSYVEFDEGFFTTTTDDSGETQYELTGSDDGSGSPYIFEVRVKFRKISVDIKNMAARTTPAPIPPQSSRIDLGWKHDGNVNFTIAGGNALGKTPSIVVQEPQRQATPTEYKAVLDEVNKRISDGDLDETKVTNKHLQDLARELYPKQTPVIPSARNSYSDETDPENQANLLQSDKDFWLRTWMWQYQQFIGNQKIGDMILPGTHDSGTYDMVTVVAQPWTQTQNLDLHGQLQAGARVLDIRSGIQADKDGDEKFILVHDAWRSEVTMANALDQTLSFCNENRNEIVMLDFHRFVDLNGATPELYAELVEVIKNRLGDKLIPASDSDKTYNELIRKTGRVIVSWNRAPTDPLFWPGVKQQWYNKPTKEELYTSIKDAYVGSLPTGLWSCCAIITPDFPNISPIQSLSPDLSLWFTPAGAWAQKSCIVSSDFIETTNLAQSLVTANILKASQS